MARVFAVIVTFHPDIFQLKVLLDCLGGQCEEVIVVDNGDPNDGSVLKCISETSFAKEKFYLVRLGENLGLAKALNVGLEYALKKNVDFVVMSDQDSVPAHDMVHNLIMAYEDLAAKGFRVGAIGPVFTDLHTGVTHPFQVQFDGSYFYGHKAPTSTSPHVEALTLITSGTLIPAAVIKDVGLMREDFFIDQVDIEWCHRARWNGYRLFGTGQAKMHQRMGEAQLRVWFFGWRYESAYSPMRIYYRLRNFVVIWKLDFVESSWKVRSSWYWIRIVFAHIIFSKKDNSKYLMYAIKGLWHGLKNSMGPLV